LKVSRPAIVADVKWLRNRAKGNIDKYVSEQLPEQYTICLAALDEIIRRAVDIMENADDGDNKLKALQLFKETHFQKLELLTDANVLDDALNKQQEEEQEQQQPQQPNIIPLAPPRNDKLF
jgi:hypothetical protein